jgi:hypothetical protein
LRVKNQIDTFAVSNYNSAINQNDTQKDGGTFVISILEEAMTHIDELEIENEELRAEIERLKARNLGGRKRHNAAWMASYQEFAIKYEAGMTIMEIVKEGQISRRTAYRYRAYYDEMINQVQESAMSDKGCIYN